MRNYMQNQALRELKTRRGRLAKAIHQVNGSAIHNSKRELFEILWQAGEDVDLDRDSAADLIETADKVTHEILTQK